MTSVELRSAVKIWADARIDASLTVAGGRRLAILGPSGCGKTTVLRMIAGLVEPDSGEILFDEVSQQGVRPEARSAAMVFQDHALFPFRTVAENVGYGLKLRKVDAADRTHQVQAALASVQLDGFDDRWPGDLSGGQRQRVALARAMVVEPRVLLLDEPLSSLDAELRTEMQTTITGLQHATGTTTIVVTHDPTEAQALADDIAVMVDGTVRQIGPAAQVVANPIDAQVAGVLGLAVDTGSLQ